MKKIKKDATNFIPLDDAQMKQITGGYYIEIKNPDGTTTKVWV